MKIVISFGAKIIRDDCAHIYIFFGFTTIFLNSYSLCSRMGIISIHSSGVDEEGCPFEGA